MKRLVLITAVLMFTLAAFYQFTIPFASAQFRDDNGPVVSINDGMIRGKADGSVIAFRGIPFAQPPVGKLRWRAPQPVQPWKGVLDALEYKPDPPQERNLDHKSEDCLYLNVFRPAVNTTAALPVMVWIYGGALANGGASMYPGGALASKGIIVVTFNYRLGRLGFFAHPALAKERPNDFRGNYGYMDQIAALQWVKKNIAAFGGDPRNVTIAGESAGAGSVLVLLTSPAAKGLFQKAIMQSPGLPAARSAVDGMRTLDDAEFIAVRYAESLGISGSDEEALERLRAIPEGTLSEGTTGAALALLGGPEVPGISHCIVDGRLVTNEPETILRTGGQAKVPVLVGANDRDLAYSTADDKYGLYSQMGTLAPKARRLYDPKGALSLQELSQNIIADKVMVEPSRNLADLVTKGGQPAYFYRFSYVAEADLHNGTGATHASEIPFAFNAPYMLEHPTTLDADMAHVMSDYWVSFVVTGNPNNRNAQVGWPPYDRTSRQALDFTNNGIYYGRDPLQERLDLWQSYWDNARVIAKNKER